MCLWFICNLQAEITLLVSVCRLHPNHRHDITRGRGKTDTRSPGGVVTLLHRQEVTRRCGNTDKRSPGGEVTQTQGHQAERAWRRLLGSPWMQSDVEIYISTPQNPTGEMRLFGASS